MKLHTRGEDQEMSVMWKSIAAAQALLEEVEGQKAKRADYIRQTFAGKWQGLPGYDELDKLIDKLAEVDPTKNGAFMPWLAKLLIKDPEQNRTEDLDRTAADIKAFEENKAKIEKKDINAYKSFADLYTAIEPFTKPRKKTKDELSQARKDKKLAAMKADIITVVNGPDGWIRIPTTKEAAIFLGQGTRWCTAAKGHNMFDHYSKSDNLFVVYDKKSKSIHQLHIMSGQFADSSDKNQGVKSVPQWARKHIIDYYSKSNPSMDLDKIMALKKFGHKEAAKGTEHEELFDLMRLYGVMENKHV